MTYENGINWYLQLFNFVKLNTGYAYIGHNQAFVGHKALLKANANCNVIMWHNIYLTIHYNQNQLRVVYV